MALPVLQSKTLGSPAFGSDLTQNEALRKQKHPFDARRPVGPRKPSLRRVKDSQEQLRSTRARGHSNVTNATIDSSTTNTTTNTSAGRSFTVANINNGIIYLRPVVRPANQRSRPLPEPVAFPQTPPDSATLDAAANNTSLLTPSNEWERSLYGPATPSQPDSQPSLPAHLKSDHDIAHKRPAHFTSPARSSSHIRSQSFSTVDEHTVASHSTEPGTFKVVIERSPHRRPKTADTGSFPILEVPIPHYRLGEPRFSSRGTAILRSSTYTSAAPSEDLRPSDFRSPLLTPQRAAQSLASSRPLSDVYSPLSFSFRDTMILPRQPSSEPVSARVSKLPINPHIYDALTTNPDDSSVVRFTSSGNILAATPSRLVAHITSPSFLDYELLSDFFLTFRAFLPIRDLIAYLISRLRWAVDRQDDFGRIVRVRTFVALRHWILNYFVDDFAPAFGLRLYFCELVNALHKDLRARQDRGAGDIKIVGELKKCWRRTCALYWPNEDAFGADAADELLLPGGEAEPHGFADEAASQMLPVAPSTPPRQPERTAKVETIMSNPSDHFAGKHMEWAQKARHTPQNSLSSPYIPSQEYTNGPAPISPTSERSMQVMSCSIPVRGLSKADAAGDMPLYPHPVPHPVPAGPSRFAQNTQKAGSSKSNRSAHGHKRSGSFSDALRDNRAPLSLPKNTTMDVAVSIIARMPGSLVRGGLFQPGSPYIDVKNGGLRHMRSHLELAHVDPSGSEFHIRGGYATNPGMKKLFGSVRRALSSKQPSVSAPQLSGLGQHLQGSPSTRSSSPGTMLTSSGGGVHKRRQTRPRPQVRIDLLASMVAESFKDAVIQQISNEQKQNAADVAPSLGEFEFEFEKNESSSYEEPTLRAKQVDPRMNSGITAGSKSILIVDDTGAPPVPMMSGALPGPGVEEVATVHPEQRSISIEAHPVDENVRTGYSGQMDSEFDSRHRVLRTLPQHSLGTQRRSMSAGREQMHSFRRRGSTKTSMARPLSLRRHSSYNSGLGRGQDVPSMATFQTMSSDNDPFSLDREYSDTAPGPTRLLRRRPGGDLRAVDNVHDLEQPQRPHSTGTVSNRTHSIANSIILRSDRYIDPIEKVDTRPTEDRGGHTSDAEKQDEKKAISLVATHSSQPNLRRSFELEVAKLAALPDDIYDDGGIESTLMKLEGRYEKRSPESPSKTSPNATRAPEVYRPTGAPVESPHQSFVPSDAGSSQPRSYAKGDDVFYRPLAPPDAEGQGMYRLSGEAFNGRAPAVHSAVESDDSYSSIPLLDRGLSDMTPSQRAGTLETMRSSAKPAPLQPTSSNPRRQETQAMSTNSSGELVVETASMKRIPKDGAMPVPADDEDYSDMGSSRGARSQTSHGVQSFYDDEPAVDRNEKDFMPMHPMRHPPTPPLTANRATDTFHAVDTVFNQGLPTPGLTPTSRLNNQPFGQTSRPAESGIELHDLKKNDGSSMTAHLPFVLAYDSEILAQQFTIIEKDALDEIDWRELIELRWKQSSPEIRDWVQYLRTSEARGVDVVIARFNLVVKWAVSECILIENIEERARCFIKYIHIAAHCRRLRNYATMYQLTIALMSNDIARLRKTWALVPAAEMQTMRYLEALVQPLRNFHTLRLEMETTSADDGCIPFIGIYTRDLIYNAQKPSFIDAPPVNGERLVNFERHHTAATIVKSLLRLLEASSKYTFKVEPHIISKCLWLAALSDEDITNRSRSIEGATVPAY
ncbi:ras GEF [Periconia macrospinosa]|uniref:Ras GEF n=1 Tax=Periconia macrospinosa TaxID=97972 RepID=A0A2V1DR84_9PLEO|nr:ras GEF [Periconia macrospinosa]